jgi:hypothetical protein
MVVLMTFIYIYFTFVTIKYHQQDVPESVYIILDVYNCWIVNEVTN